MTGHELCIMPHFMVQNSKMYMEYQKFAKLESSLADVIHYYMYAHDVISCMRLLLTT